MVAIFSRLVPDTALGHFSVLVMGENSNNKLFQQRQLGGVDLKSEKKIVVIIETIYIVLLSVGEEIWWRETF